MKRFIAMLSIFMATAGISACITGDQPEHRLNDAPSQDSPSQVASTSLKNGDIVSLRKIASSTNTTTLYEMMYFSNGDKVQAYVEVPDKAGSYPVMVYCHGGWITPRPDLFNQSQNAISLAKIGFHLPKAIYLYPEYRGYAGSSGTVHGFPDVVEDIVNALAAINAFPTVRPLGVYPYGESLGVVSGMLCKNGWHRLI
jgi:acetyl esterase/lipase